MQDKYGVAKLAFTEIHNETQYCEDVRVEQCNDRCYLMYLRDESAGNCTAACSKSICADDVDYKYGTCIKDECEEKYMLLPASEYTSCPAGLEVPQDECLSAAQSYTDEWGGSSTNTVGGEETLVRFNSLCYP